MNAPAGEPTGGSFVLDVWHNNAKKTENTMETKPESGGGEGGGESGGGDGGGG